MASSTAFSKVDGSPVRFEDSMLLNSDNPILSRINSMFLFVGTYDGFKENTLMKHLINPNYINNIRTHIGTPLNFNSFVQNDVDALVMCDPRSGNTVCGIDIDLFGNMVNKNAPETNWTVDTSARARLYPVLENSDNTPVDLNFSAVTKITDDQSAYRDRIIGFFASLFAYHLGEYRRSTSTPFDLVKFEEATTISDPVTWAKRLFVTVVLGASAYGSVTQFYVSAANSFTEIFKGRSGMDTLKNLFMVCMYPCFIFEYFLQNIGKKTPSSSDKAPRHFLLRRYAVACSYIFIYQLLRLIEAAHLVSGAAIQVQATKIQEMLSSEATDTFVKEIYNVRKDNKDNIATSKRLEEMNHEIVMARNNLSKAIVNDGSVISKVRWSLAYMIIWVVVFGLVTILCPLLYFLYSPEGWRSGFRTGILIMCGIVFFILVLSGIVQLAQSM